MDKTAETQVCICIFIYGISIIWGEKAGYSARLINISSISFIAFFSSISLTFYQVIKAIEQEVTAKNQHLYLDSLLEYTDRMDGLYQDLRKFRHDYLNILESMRIYIDDKNIDGLSAYYFQTICPSSFSLLPKEDIVGQLSYITTPSVKGLLFSKLLFAFEKNMDVNLDIEKNLSVSLLGEFDMIRVLGIFLDNALEGASETASPYFAVGLIKEEASTVLTIENSCSLNALPVPISKGAPFSTKGKGHGLGLMTVKELLTSYPEVFHTTYVKDHLFVQELRF